MAERHPFDNQPMVRALEMIDLIPAESRPSDDAPLRDHLSGGWPTIGDLRDAMADAVPDSVRAQPGPREQELNGILHKAFSHPEATDDSAQAVGTPRLVWTADGWYVADENETRFNLVSCMRPDPRHGYYKLVPEYDPTPEMEKAFWGAYRRAAEDAASPWPTENPDAGGGPFGYGYRAMLAAAPRPAAPTQTARDGGE